MEVHFPPDLEAKLNRKAMEQGRDTESLVYEAVERFIDHDEGFAQWRYHHVLMVEREIGAKSGTGGSAGVEYLRSTLHKRFFPELWGLRSYL